MKFCQKQDGFSIQDYLLEDVSYNNFEYYYLEEQLYMGQMISSGAQGEIYELNGEKTKNIFVLKVVKNDDLEIVRDK